MIVEELLATLGVKVDAAEFAEAEGAVSKLKFGLGALVAGLGLNQMKELVHSVAEVADGASKSSAKLGITAEALQELGYAGKLADVSQGQLEGALFRLGKGLDTVAQKGKGPVADALKRLGINMKDLKGEGLDANLEVIADAFAKMPDGQEKATLAMKLFGGAGKAMIPLLNGGSEALREQRDEAQKLGVVVGDDMAKKFEEFNDDQTRVGEAWRGMKVQIVTELLPVFHELVSGLLAWLKANSEVIRAGLEVAFRVVADALSLVGSAVSEVVHFFKILVPWVQRNWEVLLIIAGVLAAVLFPILELLIIFLWQAAAAWIAANAPIILIIAAIAALILIVNHWSEIWAVVSEKVGQAWDFIKEKIGAFWQWVKDKASGAADAVADAFSSLGEKIVGAVESAFEYLVDKASSAASEIWAAVKDIPVIGRLASGAESAVDFFSGSSGATDAAQAVAGARDAVANVSGGSQLSATFGDTSVTVQAGPGLDEEAVARIAAKATADAQKNMLSDAYDTMKGGRR